MGVKIRWGNDLIRWHVNQDVSKFVDSKPVDRTSAPGDGGERNEGTRPNDWSNWAAFWQGVHIWTPCENVLREIATTRWGQILDSNTHSLKCSPSNHIDCFIYTTTYTPHTYYRPACIFGR